MVNSVILLRACVWSPRCRSPPHTPASHSGQPTLSAGEKHQELFQRPCRFCETLLSGRGPLSSLVCHLYQHRLWEFALCLCCCLVVESHLLFDPMPAASSVRVILQARTLERAAISFFRASFQPSFLRCRQILYHHATRKAHCI